MRFGLVAAVTVPLANSVPLRANGLLTGSGDHQQGHTSSRAVGGAGLTRELTDVYGPRLTGSSHVRTAGDFVLHRLKQWGWTARDGSGGDHSAPVGPPIASLPSRRAGVVCSARLFESLDARYARRAGRRRRDGVIENAKDFDRFRRTLRNAFELTTSIAQTTPRANIQSARDSAEDLSAMARKDRPVQTVREVPTDGPSAPTICESS